MATTKKDAADAAVSAWGVGHSYAVGDLVTYNGQTYLALQAEKSILTWAPDLTPALWKPVAAGGVSGAVPGAPGKPVASAVTGSGATLSWTAATVAGSAVLSGYTVFQDGKAVGTAAANATSFAVTGLSANTAYSFTVTAQDQYGSSVPSQAAAVQTTGGTTPPPAPQGPSLYAAAWSAKAVYQAGATASENGLVYKASWWTQNNDPLGSSGPAGSGQPWTVVGTLKPVTAVPTVPGTPTAGGTSATGTTLYWAASTVPGGGDVSDYAVYENGTRIGTTTGTSFTVTGLAPATTYGFTVAAEDVAGLSAQSAAKAVTTVATMPGGGAALAPTFAPYVDMGLAADADLVALSRASGAKVFTLAFLQSSGPGTVGWSGVGTLADDTLANGSTILDQVNALRATGGDVIISFGGAAGTDPAAVATGAAQLQGEYQSVIDRYHVTSLDFDIEGGQVADKHAIALRDQALVGLKAANPGLTISYTLPVLPDGLDNNGVAVLSAAKADGLTPDVVNVMAMDYGASVDNGGAMGADAISAAKATVAQMRFIGLTSKVGITPMIGVNDVASEVFTQADARALLSYAQGNPDVARLAMWSIARDNGSGAGQHWASSDSSGLAQKPFEFSSIFQQYGQS